MLRAWKKNLLINKSLIIIQIITIDFEKLLIVIDNKKIH